MIVTASSPKGFKIKFKFFEDPELIETPMVVASPDMRLNFNKVVQINPVTKVTPEKSCILVFLPNVVTCIH